MRERFMHISLLSAVILFASQVWTVSGQARQPAPQSLTGEVMDTICAKTVSHAEMMAKFPSMGHDSETCTKKCAEMGAKYVLVSDADKVVYTLDDQAKAQTLAGHKVRVSGTVQQNQIKVASVDVIG